MSSPRLCIDCEKPLDDGLTGGVCPACLLGEEEAEVDDGLVAGHEVIEEIARGGMGIVYRAVDLEAGREIALKVLLPQTAARPGMCERFRVEAQAAASFDHSAILPVYRVGETNELPYMTMKLAESGSLAERKGAYHGQWREIAKLVATLAGAIHFAHSRGVLHRDVKPANILFDSEDKPYLADFGLAKILDSDHDLTQSIQFLGTPLYVAPELVSGHSTAASVVSDVWSLGAVLHELLAGVPPFEAEGLSGLFRAIADDEPALVSQKFDGPKVPRDLKVICLKCLAKKPEDRYQSAADLAQDLQSWLENRPIKARRASLPERAFLRIRKNPILSGLALAFLMSLVAIAVLHFRQVQETRRSLVEAYSREANLELTAGNFMRREPTLDVIDKATAIERSPELRDQLISALAWPALEIQELGSAPIRDSTYDLPSRWVVTTSENGAEIRSRKTGEKISTISFDPTEYHIVGPISPDQRFLIMRHRGFMELRDVRTGDRVMKINGVRFSLTLDRKGKRVAFAANGGNIQVIDFSGAKPKLEELGDDSFRLVPKAFSPDGKALAVKREYTSKPALLLIDSRSGKLIREIKVPRAGNTQRAVYHPDGKSLFVGFSGGNIHQISLEKSLPPIVYVGHSDRISWLGLLEGGRLLVSQSEDETTRIWDTATSESLAELPWSGEYHGCQGTFENRFFVRMQDEMVEGSYTASPVVSSVALPDPSPDYAAPKGSWLMKLSPNGRYVAVSAMQNLHFVSTNSWEIAQSFPIVAVFDLGFDFNTGTLFAGRTVSIFKYFRKFMREYEEKVYHYPAATASRVAWAGAELGVAVSWKGEGIRFRGEKSDSPHQLLEGKTVHALDVTQDHKLLLASTDDEIHVYDLSSGAPAQTLEIPAKMVRNLSVSLDKKTLISGGEASYDCWDLTTGKKLWSLPHHLNSMNFRPLALARDVGLIAVALDDYSVSLVSMETGKTMACLRHPNRHRVRDVEITGDGHHVAVLTTGHLVKVWHLEPLASELKKRGFDADFVFPE